MNKIIFAVICIVSLVISVKSEADDKKHNHIHDIGKKELHGSESVAPVEIAGVAPEFPYGYGFGLGGYGLGGIYDPPAPIAPIPAYAGSYPYANQLIPSRHYPNYLSYPNYQHYPNYHSGYHYEPPAAPHYTPHVPVYNNGHQHQYLPSTKSHKTQYWR